MSEVSLDEGRSMQVTTPVVPETTIEAPPIEVVIPETPQEAQILELAADILETEGWCRNSWAAFGNRCAVGGIGAAVRRMTFRYGERAKSRRAAEAALAKLVRESIDVRVLADNVGVLADKCTIERWNDVHASGKEQVVRKMREAAARLTPKL